MGTPCKVIVLAAKKDAIELEIKKRAARKDEIEIEIEGLISQTETQLI